MSASRPSAMNILDVKLYRNGRLTEGGISIADGKITKLGKEASLLPSEEVVRGKGLVALPGLIDVHVHLRDLQLSYKEDFFSGTCAAAAGGFTTVIDMPNTNPVTDSAERLREKMDVARKKIVVNVGFNAVPASLDTVIEAKDLAIGYKVNLVKQWSSLPTDDASLTALIDRAASVGKLVIFHAEEGGIVSELESRFKGSAAFKSYYKAHPVEAEEAAVARVLRCITSRAARVHLCHISSISSLGLIRKAKRAGRSVTCEVTPHHMLLGEESSSRRGGVSIMDPPLRRKETAGKLFAAFRRGIVDIVASDHAPHAIQEKASPHWWEIPPGIPGLETSLPLMLTEVAEGRVSLKRVVEAMTESPAKIFGLNRGELKEGAVADIILVDMKRTFKINSAKFLSKAKYSPFDGRNVTGKVIKTFVAGNLVYDDGKIIGKPGVGSILSPNVAHMVRKNSLM